MISGRNGGVEVEIEYESRQSQISGCLVCGECELVEGGRRLVAWRSLRHKRNPLVHAPQYALAFERIHAGRLRRAMRGVYSMCVI